MIQYFTYREYITPQGHIPLDYHLKNNFNGLEFSYRLAIVQGYQKDGRKLGMIEADAQDKIDAILRSFPCDYETPEQALDKAKRWTTLPPELADQITLDDNGYLVFPDPEENVE